MTLTDLRQACPEFFDFVVAMAKQVDYGDRNGEEPPWSVGSVDRARALLAKLEAEKASAETPCEVHGPNPGYATRADDCTCPKPVKPQERSAHQGMTYDEAERELDARGEVIRVLRAERDELAASVGRYQQLCRTLETQLVSLKP